MRQLRKKHFLREYNSLALFSQDQPPPFPGGPYAYQDGGNEWLSWIFWPISWASINGVACRREVGNSYVGVQTHQNTQASLGQTKVFIQANNEKTNFKWCHFFNEDCKDMVFLSCLRFALDHPSCLWWWNWDLKRVSDFTKGFLGEWRSVPVPPNYKGTKEA